MRRLAAICAVISALVWALANDAQAEDYNLGVRRLLTEVAGTPVPIRLFYPTNAQAEATRFGPWELFVAKDAMPAAGPFPLIVISHGLSGNGWNHHLLARDLVEVGFVVAATQHPDDLLRIGRPEVAVLRPLELSAGIDAVLNDAQLGPRVDATKIGAFGFSLGGFTALSAAGGLADHDRIRTHCAQAANDPEFCIGEEGGARLPIWLRIRRMGYSIPKVDVSRDVIDGRISAVVAAAPVGVPFQDMSRVQMPVLLLRAGADRALRFPYHAEHVRSLLPAGHSYQTLEGLHHYAFLSPFPASIARDVGAPAEDPEGFDRKAFLEEINQVIVAFFKTNLMLKDP